ncbi:hypothetical protein [Clostridium felsineum]|uniref:hypothetical protein n=1 Tax=Clostridium felsineum TaxID=36839 RepID=UPI00098C5E57|nr:hypothetical protein [Clostridium felsineum]
MRNALIEAQNRSAEELAKAREVERKKVEKENDEKISELECKLNTVNIDNENLLNEKKKLKKQLKKQISLIATKTAAEIDKRVADKIAALDYAPKLLEVCNSIDETISAKVSVLKGINESMDTAIDDISKQRIYSTLNNIEDNVKILKDILQIEDIENVSIGVINDNKLYVDFDNSDTSESDTATQTVHFTFE